VNVIHPSESFQCCWTPSHHELAGLSDLDSDLSMGTRSTVPCAQHTRTDRSTRWYLAEPGRLPTTLCGWSPAQGGKSGQVMDLHRSRCGGEMGCQRLVMGKREVASDDVLHGFSSADVIKGTCGVVGVRDLRGTRFGAV